MGRASPGTPQAWGIVAALVGLWVVLMSWAVMMPIGSSPDDDYHLSSIWCAGGSRDGCLKVDDSSRAVPIAVVAASECYRFEADTAAACADILFTDSGPLLTQTTDRVNQVAGLYPEGFYAFANLFVGDDVPRTVLIIRTVNATLAVLALAWVVAVTPRAVRSAITVAVAVVWVPLGLWVVPSTNPSSWAFTGLLLLTAAALATWVVPRSPRTWLALGGAFLGALMAISARVDAAAYVVVTIVVVSVYVGWTRVRARPLASVVMAGLAVWGVAAFVFSNPPVPSGTDDVLGTAESGLGLLLTNASFLLVYVQGVVGGWPLFWNDTVLPPSIPVLGTLILGAVIAIGMQRMGHHKAFALLISSGALVGVPLVFLQMQGLGVGEVVQPRYIAPLLLLTVVVVLLPRTPDDIGPLSRVGTGLLWSVIIGLSASATLAWWVSAHRFEFGSDAPLFDAELITPSLPGLVITAAAGTVWIGMSWITARGPNKSRDRMITTEEGR